MENGLAKFLDCLPQDTRTVSVRQLIAALSTLPGNKSVNVKIDEQGQDWILQVNLSQMSR
jgi:hypothetical protein